MENTESPPKKGRGKSSEPAANVDFVPTEQPNAGAHEEELETALDRLEKTVDESSFASRTLIGDVQASILEMFKRRPKPWDALSQDEKRDLAGSAEILAKAIVNQALDIVAAEERPVIRAIVENVSAGDKVKATLSLASLSEDAMGAAISDLYKCRKKTVLIITADAQDHMGSRGELVPPDQTEMPFDPGADGDENED